MSSKKEKSSIVRGAGLLTSIFTNLQKEVEKQGGDEKDIHRLTTPEGQRIIEQIAELIVKAGYPRKEDFKIIVDYNQDLEQMIKAGKYGWVNSDITAEYFLVKEENRQELTITLFHFNRTITSDEVKTEIDKQGFRLAKIEELLGLGEKCPDLQEKFQIIALGLVWQASRSTCYAPYLGCHGAERDLSLHYCGRGSNWSANWRFAALRK